MLGKIIKYDLKSTSRFLILIHAFLLLASLGCRFLLVRSLNFNTGSVNELLLSLTFIIFFIMFIGANFATYIIIAVRFYKNLFSDEGYLSLTLPVRRSVHLAAKTISGSIWAIIDMIFLCLCLYILMSIPLLSDALTGHWDEFLALLGYNGSYRFSVFLLLMGLTTVTTGVSNVVFIEISVLLGQLFNGHKVLGAVVSYFSLSTVMSVLMTIVMGLRGMLFVQDNMYSSASNSYIPFAGYMQDLLIVCLGFSVALSVIFYAASYLIFQRRINLS